MWRRHRGFVLAHRRPHAAFDQIEQDADFCLQAWSVGGPRLVSAETGQRQQYTASEVGKVGQFQPDGWRTVTPRLITHDVEGLVEFLKSVFGAQGEIRPGSPVEMKIGDSIVMISDGGGLRETGQAFLYVYVANADETYRRAIAAGALAIETPVDTPYGDRRATIRDSWGNMWQIATHTAASEDR
jgi:PhnB protein